VIDVIDNGIGLPKENRNRLLEPYVTTREKGTGLGLAIVGRILEEHGGGIELRDAADIPGAARRLDAAALCRIGHAPKAAEGAEKCAGPKPRSATNANKNRSRNRQLTRRGKPMASDILIVDDEADIRELVAGILQDEGYRRAPRATATALARSPTAGRIWCSSTSGCRAASSTACSCSTASSAASRLPVVMISGHGNIETAVAAIKRGAYDFIEKPFKADRLVLVATARWRTSRLKREVKELKQLAPADQHGRPSPR
jgi:CheY-like chemotaxis protein